MTADILEREDPIWMSDDSDSWTDPPRGPANEDLPPPGSMDLQEWPRIPSPTKAPLQAAGWFIKGSLALLFLVAQLALAAAIPLVNVLVLGYLMEVQGRVARTGKLRKAFYMLPAAQRLGVALLALWLWLLPIQFLAGLARDSWLLAPGSATTWLLTGVLLLTSLLIAIHLVAAIGCGAQWWRFVRPLRNLRQLRERLRAGDCWPQADQQVRQFVAALRLPHLLRLGLLGYASVYLVLALPALLFTILDDLTSRWQMIGFGVGCVSLSVTLLWLPMAVAHVAAEARWRAIFEIKPVLKIIARAPFCWAMTTAILLACSILPLLYTALLKNQIPPHQVRWDLMLVFLVTVIPARLLVGWAYHRGLHHGRSSGQRRWRVWRALNTIALSGGVGFYVYFLYLASTGGELGQSAIWEFQALLLPSPF